MKRVALLDDYQRVALTSADWSSLRGRVELDTFDEHIEDEDVLAEALSAYEIVVAMRERTPFRRSLLERLPRLELFVGTGPVSRAMIDVHAAADLGIVVSGTGGYRPPASELTWALILTLVKRVHQFDRDVKAGLWQTRMGGDLAGARLGVIGLGDTGSRVARVGQAFGMDVVAWSENLTEERTREAGVRRVEREELLATSDIVSIHLRLSDRTRGLIGEPELRLLKPSAYLVNTSRGPVVDADALVRALRERWFGGAALDVFDREPLASDDPLRSLENVVLTPHVGYVTPTSYEMFYAEAAENIDAFLRGDRLRVVEPDPANPFWWAT